MSENTQSAESAQGAQGAPSPQGAPRRRFTVQRGGCGCEGRPAPGTDPARGTPATGREADAKAGAVSEPAADAVTVPAAEAVPVAEQENAR